MDETTTINELKNKIKNFCEARDWDQFHTPKELAIAISTESSELLEFFRFKNEREIDKLLKDDKKREEIGEEMADILWFLFRFSQRNDIDLSNALNKKLEKNNLRYPIEKAKGSNKKYNELEK